MMVKYKLISYVIQYLIHHAMILPHHKTISHDYLPTTYVVQGKVMGFSLNGAELSLNSANSENLVNH